jgi:hypothetical protein
MSSSMSYLGERLRRCKTLVDKHIEIPEYYEWQWSKARTGTVSKKLGKDSKYVYVKMDDSPWDAPRLKLDYIDFDNVKILDEKG